MNNEHKCLIIYNPTSGKSISKSLLEKYKKILNDKGYNVDILPTQYTNHAVEMVANAKDYEIVFSIGGDGTLNEVVKGNYQREKKLTICPLPNGTCNDVATMLGYGNDPIQNLTRALEGEVHYVDIGTINDSPFAYVVGVGKLMNIPYETKGEDKRKNGYMAYIKEGLGEIIEKMKRYKAEVTIDGKRIDGNYSLIMISNANHIAGINGFHKDVCLNDGEMEVLLCKSKNKREFIINFLKYFLGIETHDIISLKAHDVSIKLLDTPEKKWCIDGEKYDYDGSEYHIKIREQMEFLTPKIKSKKLFRAKEIKA